VVGGGFFSVGGRGPPPPPHEGVDVRAVTNWAVFGSHGWNTLLTAPGLYEPGAYDISGGQPRATALVPLLGSLSRSDDASVHPALHGKGWWRRSIRLHHPAVPRPAFVQDHMDGAGNRLGDAAPILILGATGTLGGAIAAACRHRDLPHILTHRGEIDLSDPGSIERGLERHRPWAVINAAGWVRVDDAEREVDLCLAANAIGAEALARGCADRGIHSTSFSSDLVFGGVEAAPYGEADAPAPLNAYGRSKAAMEQAVRSLPGQHLIVRTAAFFSPFDPHNFASHLVRALGAGAAFQAADDEVVTPTYVPDLCNAVLDLVIDGAEGIWHLTNGEGLSWAGFAVRLARTCGLDEGMVCAVPGQSLGLRAPRPTNTALVSTRGALLPPLQQAIDQFAGEVTSSLFSSSLSKGFRSCGTLRQGAGA
jgi:dTDP-4-dehydrorhamnose reductase